jgi:hypothetical protein
MDQICAWFSRLLNTFRRSNKKTACSGGLLSRYSDWLKAKSSSARGHPQIRASIRQFESALLLHRLCAV